MYSDKDIMELSTEFATYFFNKYANCATWKQFRLEISHYLELFDHIENSEDRIQAKEYFTLEAYSNLGQLGFEFEFEER